MRAAPGWPRGRRADPRVGDEEQAASSHRAPRVGGSLRLVQARRAGRASASSEVLEAMVAEVAEREVRARVQGDVAGRLRDDHLTAVCGRADAGRHVHVQPDVACRRASARRYGFRSPFAPAPTPATAPHPARAGRRRPPPGHHGRARRRGRRRRRPSRPRCRGAWRSPPGPARESGSAQLRIGSQRLEQQRRRLDVCEEEGHRAGRQRTCLRVATGPPLPPRPEHSHRARGPASGSPARALGANAQARSRARRRARAGRLGTS